MKNYDQETCTDTSIDILALKAIYEMMLKAEETIAEMEDRMDVDQPEPIIADW